MAFGLFGFATSSTAFILAWSGGGGVLLVFSTTIPIKAIRDISAMLPRFRDALPVLISILTP